MNMYRVLSIFCLFTFWVIFNGCQPQPDPAALPVPANEAGAKKPAQAPAGVGPYTITFIGVTYANGQSTWTYSVQRTGAPQGNGLSHLIFGLGCVDPSQVANGTIDGRKAKLEFSEGKGTGCQVTGNFVKFEDVSSNVSDGGTHTFSFTLNTMPDAQTDMVWVKAGNACYQSNVTGPGCGTPATFELKGRMEIRYCMGLISWPENVSGQIGSYGVHVAGIPVQLLKDNVVVATTTTDGGGYYSFNNIAAGTYKVKVDHETYNNTAKGCNNSPVMPIMFVHDMTELIPIPSAYYEQMKNKVDFWLDTYPEGQCGPDILEGWVYERGQDSYNCK